MDKQLQALQHNLEAAVQHAMESCATSGHGASDHFRGVTKLITYSKRWASDQFATRRVANPIVVARNTTTEKPSAVRVGWRALS